jgi:alpha-glucosidase
VNLFSKIIFALRTLGLVNIFRSIRYARLRDRQNAAYSPPLGLRPASPRRLVSAKSQPGGALFHFEAAELEVYFLQPDLVRLSWDGTPSPSYAVQDNEWPEVSATLTRQVSGWILHSDRLEIRVAEDGTLEILDASGGLIRRDLPPSGRTYGWIQSAALDPDACVYGLGERASRLNLRPGSYRFWNIDQGGSYAPGADPLYICMPVYLCLQPAGSSLVFYDNTFSGQIELGRTVEIQFDGGPACYYVAVGQPPALLELFTGLTGRAPLPPRWALGYHQSRFGYRTEREMRRVFEEFQRLDLPLSALYLDSDHFERYCTFTVDPRRYPDLPGFARELKERGVHLVASTNPGINVDPVLEMYRQGLTQDIFCKDSQGRQQTGLVWPGWTAFPDFTYPPAREWWGKQYAGHATLGIDGFWHDMNEPASFAAWGELSLPLSTRHELEGRGADHREAHNIYGLLMNRAGYEGLRRIRPENRPFILSRSGWVGMQRHAWTWTGDTETSWPILRQTIACVLGLGLSGQPYAGPDVGGFSGRPGPELFVRWFQLASCLPFFRTHSSTGLPHREPWEFGPEILSLLRRSLQDRYRLLPLWYTLSWQTSQDGCPIVRPLFWRDPADHRLWEVDDAFLLGDYLLVAPVLEPGANARRLALPAGEWYELEGSQVYPGGQEIRLDAPLERIPILVRGGSILPVQGADGLELHVYAPAAGGEGAGLLYSDAGDGYGPWRLDRFYLRPDGDSWAFSNAADGDFPWPYGPLTLILHGLEGINLGDLSSQINVSAVRPAV